MDSVNKKRTRDESSESDSVHVKRLREDLLVDSDSDTDPTVDDLASVMKSFEEEISGCSASGLDSGESRPELGYLLEASDDELGLPPSSNVDGAKTEEVEVVEPVLAESDRLGDGEVWGFGDGMPSFDSLEFGDNGSFDGNYVAFGDGLFDYSDECFESSDFPWRSETMPAI